jgi:hypothetical protein
MVASIPGSGEWFIADEFGGDDRPRTIARRARHPGELGHAKAVRDRLD